MQKKPTHIQNYSNKSYLFLFANRMTSKYERSKTCSVEELRWSSQLVLSRAFTSTIATPQEIRRAAPPPPPPPTSPTVVTARMWFGTVPLLGDRATVPTEATGSAARAVPGGESASPQTSAGVVRSAVVSMKERTDRVS